MAAKLFRRWNEEALVDTRRMVGRFTSAEELRDAFAAYVAADAPEAYVLCRELDYFEQLAALESQGAFDLELIKLLPGRTLIARWEMWRPAIHEAHGPSAYPLFEGLVEKPQHALDNPALVPHPNEETRSRHVDGSHHGCATPGCGSAVLARRPAAVVYQHPPVRQPDANIDAVASSSPGGIRRLPTMRSMIMFWKRCSGSSKR